MITYTKLHQTGRMGNQLFELACCISTALRNNDSYVFPPWKYENDFNLHNCYSENIIPTLIYYEPFFHYQEVPYFNTKNEVLNIVGYQQSYKYFNDYREEILRLLTPKPEFEKEEGLCSIHCRRGDYVHQPQNHPTQPMSYYEKAMELSGCKKFLVFGDDEKWNREHFVGNQFEFSEGNNEVVDLAMMAKKCESNVICNSSFSWWGTYLNQSKKKVVIAPKLWFGSAMKHQTNDLYVPGWIKV